MQQYPCQSYKHEWTCPRGVYLDPALLVLASPLLHVANAVVCTTARALTFTRLGSHATGITLMICKFALSLVALEVQAIAVDTMSIDIFAVPVANANPINFNHIIELIGRNECPVLFGP